MKDVSHIFAKVPAWHTGLDSGETDKLKDIAARARAMTQRRPNSAQAALDRYDAKAEALVAEFEALERVAVARLSRNQVATKPAGVVETYGGEGE